VNAHLTPVESIDALDGTLPEDRRAHLDQCARCRADVSALADTAGDIGHGDVPEPSPLFWDHQSRRIAAAISTEPESRPSWLPRLAWSGVAAAALIAALLVFVPHRSPSGADTATRTAAVSTPTGQPADIEGDRAWTLLTTVGSDLDEDSAVEALHPSPGTIDEAVNDLEPNERAVLAALLREALKPGNAPVAAGL
jgi:negative regulator of sigma E activity